MQQRLSPSAPTLQEVLDDFLQYRQVKERTKTHYRQIMTLYLRDWLPVPMEHISGAEIHHRHHLITQENGPAAANTAMRVLSIFFNYAMFKYRHSITENPVKMLTQLRGWNKLQPQHRVIKKELLAQWYQTIGEIKSDNLRDSYMLMLFAGLRKGEVVRIRWEDVNFKDLTFTVRAPKNGHDHELPMSSYLHEIFKRRYLTASSEWVFPNKNGTRPMSETSNCYVRLGLKSGILWSPHDLRRTFVLVARSVKTDPYTVKHLLNHVSNKDITYSCYTNRDVNELREPMERICHALKFHMGMPIRVQPYLGDPVNNSGPS